MEREERDTRRPERTLLDFPERNTQRIKGGFEINAINSYANQPKIVSAICAFVMNLGKQF